MRRLTWLLVVAVTGICCGLWWHQDDKIVSGSGWSVPEHSKVVCYHFSTPPGVESSFSLINNSRLNRSLLSRQTIRSSELNSEQVTRLVNALFAPVEYRSAACYDPHHMFAFYRSDGSVSGVAEICFGCSAVSTLPHMSEQQLHHQDFLSLARLVDELKLWPDDFGSVDEWHTLHPPFASQSK